MNLSWLHPSLAARQLVSQPAGDAAAADSFQTRESIRETPETFTSVLIRGRRGGKGRPRNRRRRVPCSRRGPRSPSAWLRNKGGLRKLGSLHLGAAGAVPARMRHPCLASGRTRPHQPPRESSPAGMACLVIKLISSGGSRPWPSLVCLRCTCVQNPCRGRTNRGRLGGRKAQSGRTVFRPSSEPSSTPPTAMTPPLSKHLANNNNKKNTSESNSDKTRPHL
ncbi:UNVERIFIED_CONTAM: hypothetical protein K2H54_072209 [Gekko kuhli]